MFYLRKQHICEVESCLITAFWRQRAFSCGISHPPRWAEVEEGQVGHQSFPLRASFPWSAFAMSTWKWAFSEAPHVLTWLSLVDPLKFRGRPAFLHATHAFFGNIEKTMRIPNLTRNWRSSVPRQHQVPWKHCQCNTETVLGHSLPVWMYSGRTRICRKYMVKMILCHIALSQ